jgi:hypothetical protein
MRPIHGTALIALATVFAAACAASRYDAQPQTAPPEAPAAAPAQPQAGQPQPAQAPAPRIRIKKIERAPESEQSPAANAAATTQPGTANQPTVVITTTTAPVRGARTTPAAPATPAAAAFEKIKALAGTWEMENPPIATPEGITEFKVVFRVTAGASVVEEIDFPGTVRENIQMYQLDGSDALLMTHYCPLGSQPRMRATRFDDPQRISFVYLDGTNLDPEKDRHCHNMVLTFLEPDRLQQDWTFYVRGEKYHVRTLTWKRVKN